MSAIPESQTSHPASGERLIVLVRPNEAGRVCPDWVAALRQALPGAIPMAPARGPAGGLERLPVDQRDLAALRVWLNERETPRWLLILSCGVVLPEYLGKRLLVWMDSADRPDVILLPGNLDPALDPLAGLSGPTLDPLGIAGIDSLACAAGSARWLPARWRAQAASLIAPGAGPPRIGLIDNLILSDPDRPAASAEQLLPQARAAFGLLRRRLDELLAQRLRSLPLFGFAPEPVTLHISHAWGGGIQRWIADQCRGDADGLHLVLSAAGRQDGQEHGQRLCLWALGPEQGLIGEWPLSPAIADSALEHAGYRDRLERVIARYGVGRIVVSSLIGHSLEALRSGLPTLQVLHDFYPASPLLHVDPLASLDRDGRLDLAPALAAHRGELMFESTDPAHWHALGQAWHRAVVDEQVQLLSPTRHVADRWQRLFGQRLPDIAIQAHGYSRPPEWPGDIPARPLDDGRLRLVVVGRMSEGKGLSLLEQALAAGLSDHARITLIGAGREAERLFGRAGVDILLDYRPESLPDLLARIGPDAALFLSTVPETWNYVLSELRALALTPIATRLGSFEERIDDGVDGLLFDPEPQALIETVAGWKTRAAELRLMGRRADREPSVVEAAEAYRRLVAERASQAAAGGQAPLEAAELGEASEQLRAQARDLSAMRTRVSDQRGELARRADWAQRAQRLADQRTDWALSLEQALSTARQTVAEQAVSLRQLSEQVERFEQERQRLEQVQHHLEKSWALERTRLSEDLDYQRERADEAEYQIALMSSSGSWRLTRPLRLLARLVRFGLAVRVWNPLRWPGLVRGGYRSLRIKGIKASLASLYRPPVRIGLPESRFQPEQAAPVPEVPPVRPVSLPAHEQVVASIIVPVYNQVALTSACLNSLVEQAGSIRFEVVVVDDCSDTETADYLDACSGLVSLRNEQNAGFIDTCNRGAAKARGEFLVFLNNDTTLTPGWLEALLAPFEQDPEAGIVGAKLVYPDGRLQEAGGIIFSDASGWNYGKGDDPGRPQYNFLSEADYVSGACLAIRAADFERFGGFDTRYRPAYYEDTDLCFQMRQAGRKVLYQPACVVVHHEGATSGTDETSGPKRHQVINRERFSDKWREVLAHHPPPEPDHSRADPVRRLRYWRSTRRALVIDANTPQPDHDSGSVRMRALMDLLRARGYLVTFMPENRLAVPPYTEQLTQSGIEVLHAPMVPELAPWLAEHGHDLDLIVASRYYVLAPLIRLLRFDAPQARLVFDTVDLHFLREQREAELTGDALRAEQAEATRVQELDLIDQADVTLVVSPVEQALLEDLKPQADIRVLSNIHQVAGPGPAFSERAGLLFVGGFQHQPNVDAVRWLADSIFPLIRQALPDVELHLVGSRMPEEIVALGHQRGITVHGFVADLTPFLNGCRVSLAPLRYGAGVKGKVNQAMSHGLPVVATGCAAEGMYLEHERDVLVADQAADFAAQVIRLYKDPVLWSRLAEGGLANVEQHFSLRAAERVLADLDPAD